MNRGSEWRKGDLHVHTPDSIKQQFSFSSDEEKESYNDNIRDNYIDQLEDIQDVTVIGIIDYFSIEGYNKCRNIDKQEDYKISI